MVALPQTYNTADLPSSQGMALIPPGYYQAIIVASDLKPTSKNDGQFLALTVIVTQGQYANTEFTERLNIINNSAKAVEIAYKTLARISEAVGMTQTPAESSQLHNKPLMIEVVTEAGTPYKDKETGLEKQGKDKSIIKGYKALPAGGAPAPFAQQAAPAMASAPGTPPWAKK